MSTSRTTKKPLTIVTLLLLAGTTIFVLTAPSITPPPTPPPVEPPTAAPPPTLPPPTTLPPVTLPPTTLPPVTAPPPTAPVEPPPAPVEPVAAPAEGTPLEYWDRMAQCETGGNWQHFPYGTYTGGLGIYNGTWLGWGGGEFAPTAGQATKEQQIVVAERIATDVGYSAWGCVHAVGYP